MGILLILIQVIVVVLHLAAHALNVNDWVLALPALLFGVLWLVGLLTGCVFVVDSFAHPYRRR